MEKLLVRVGGKQYILDLELKQLRNVSDSKESKTFKSHLELLEFLNDNGIIRGLVRNLMQEYIIL